MRSEQSGQRSLASMASSVERTTASTSTQRVHWGHGMRRSAGQQRHRQQRHRCQQLQKHGHHITWMRGPSFAGRLRMASHVHAWLLKATAALLTQKRSWHSGQRSGKGFPLAQPRSCLQLLESFSLLLQRQRSNGRPCPTISNAASPPPNQWRK